MSLQEAFVHSLAGSIGGMLAFAAFYPLDNIRARLQVQVHHARALSAGRAYAEQPATAAACQPVTPASLGQAVGSRSFKSMAAAAKAAAAAAAEAAAAGRAGKDEAIEDEYEGTWDCAAKVARKEGWLALYNGLTSGVVGVGVSSAIYFWWYFLLKRIVLRRTGTSALSSGLNMLVAAVAGVINITMTSPIWVVNLRMTIQHQQQAAAGAGAAGAGAAGGAARGAARVAGEGQEQGGGQGEGQGKGRAYTGIVDALQRIVAEEGLVGLYRGFLPSLILVSNPATQFVVYEQLTRRVTEGRTRSLQARVAEALAAGRPTKGMATKGTLTALEAFVLSAVAKAVATVVTYPYQVIKSRQQAERGRADQAPSMLSVLLSMYRNEGVAVFTQGLGAKLTQTVSNAALTFLIYNQIVRAIQAAARAAQRAAAAAKAAAAAAAALSAAGQTS